MIELQGLHAFFYGGTSIWYSYNGTAKDNLALQVQLYNRQSDGTFKNNQLHFEVFIPRLIILGVLLQ